MFSTRGCVPDVRPLECIKKYCPKGSISQYTPKGAGIALDNKIMPFNIIPVASEYEEIHPNGVVNINNVKINSTMMREWTIFKQAHLGSCQKPGFL